MNLSLLKSFLNKWKFSLTSPIFCCCINWFISKFNGLVWFCFDCAFFANDIFISDISWKLNLEYNSAVKLKVSFPPRWWFWRIWVGVLMTHPFLTWRNPFFWMLKICVFFSHSIIRSVFEWVAICQYPGINRTSRTQNKTQMTDNWTNWKTRMNRTERHTGQIDIAAISQSCNFLGGAPTSTSGFVILSVCHSVPNFCL